MRPTDRGAAPKRMMAIQFAVLASLAAFYFLYLPYRSGSRSAAEAQERELKIEALFQSLVVEDAHSEVEVTGTRGNPVNDRSELHTIVHIDADTLNAWMCGQTTSQAIVCAIT